MRIDDRDSVKAPASRTGATRESGRAEPARRFEGTGVEGTDGDQVAFAHQQSLLARALEAGVAERQQKVEQLRQQVQAGTYYVDARELGRAIIRELVGGEAG